MPDLGTFMSQKKWNFCRKSDSSRPRLVSVVCSLKHFVNGLICWQLIVKATPSLWFWPEGGNA